MTSTANDLTERLGAVLLEPDLPIIAGRHGSWTITLTVGSYGIDEGGTIKIARRLANDWEAPQFDRPGESGYCTVTTNGDAVLKPRYERKGHIRPWLKCLVIDVIDGSLAPGDKVRVVMGDRSQGSPGMRAQSFVESRHEIRVLVDPTNACLVRPLPTSPVMRIIADEPVRMIAVVPSLVEVGRTFQIYCRGEDRWGNPTPLKTAPGIDWTGTGAVSRAADGWTAISPGLGQFRLACGDLEGTSNSVEFVKTLPALRPFWGDLHAQTDSTVGTGTEEEYFRFGREQARLDFIGHQGNDFQITSEDWTRLNEAINRHNEDHAYVTLPGYEWSGNTPAGGDRNVFFLQENPPIFRSSHWQVPGETEDSLSPAHPADQLFERVKAHGNAFTCAHVGGRYADITRYFDQDVCPLVEVASCWGIFEWILRDALERDYVVGVMANSDGHKGRPRRRGSGRGGVWHWRRVDLRSRPGTHPPGHFRRIDQSALLWNNGSPHCHRHRYHGPSHGVEGTGHGRRCDAGKGHGGCTHRKTAGIQRSGLHANRMESGFRRHCGFPQIPDPLERRPASGAGAGESRGRAALL